jgi:FtsP/CotA-like multicopper oxidase with cupredoxin domain
LRARLGDVVQITFVNQIDANRFPYSIDQGEKRGPGSTNPALGCDVSSPGNPAAGYPLLGGDAYPDCFHGSSTGNIHFHGTHTSPDSTADNVLLEILPSPREGANRMPTVTPESASRFFGDFFMACESQLRANPLSIYPQTWKDAPLGPWTMPGTWTADQTRLLKEYDQQTEQNLWATNKSQIDQNKWPQYYIGAYPYCFTLPEYKEASWPPPPGGRSPIMGQSPGTHWYHAHKHGSTAINVANGMTGVFIIEGDYDDKLNAFYGTGWSRTQPVMVINQLGVSPNLLRQPSPGGGPGAGSQDKGTEFSVNGRSQPIVEMAPGEVQMWRIANTSRSVSFITSNASRSCSCSSPNIAA